MITTYKYVCLVSDILFFLVGIFNFVYNDPDNDFTIDHLVNINLSILCTSLEIVCFHKIKHRFLKFM